MKSAEIQNWLALAVFVQTTGLFGLMWASPELMDNQGFMTLASAVIVTGWVGTILGFAFQAGKTIGEQTAAVNKALDFAIASQPAQTEPTVTLKPGETAQAADAP